MEPEEAGKTWSIIPEFFFDLISRIPAGIFLILLTTKFVVPDQANFSDIDLSKLFLLILFGYSVGIMLSAPAKLLAKFYFKSVWKKYLEREKATLTKFLVVHPLENINSDSLTNLDNKQIQFIYRETHDYTKNNNEQAKVMLPKLSAESSVANNFAAA
jgi:hypothetical protein